MERVPEAVARIERSERAVGGGAPFRVQRLPTWPPSEWSRAGPPARAAEIVAWERDTLQPKYGLTYGIEYTYTQDAAGLYEYMRFYETATRPADAGPGSAEPIYPRRAFDLWNTRYFVVTKFPARWREAHPWIAALLADTEPLEASSGADGGFQVLRNRSAMPRAWIVHAAHEGAEGGLPEALTAPARPAFNPREALWLERGEAEALAPFLLGGAPAPSESVTVVRHELRRVELDAVLERPGVVVLAEVFYPGWRLTIDDVEAPIHRVNHLMRGAAVPKGRHRLVYRYEPRSFVIGLSLSAAGAATLTALGALMARRGGT
jgi:hypothetical protein